MKILSIAAVAALSVLVHGQVAYTLEDGSFGTGAGASPAVYLPSAGYTTGGSDPRGPIPLPEYANLPPTDLPGDVGGYAIDQKSGRMFSCNGFWVQSEEHPLYGTPAMASSAGLGVWFDSGEITGMAVGHDVGGGAEPTECSALYEGGGEEARR